MNDEQLKELQQLREEIQHLRERLDELGHKLEQVSQRATPPPPEPVPASTIPSSPVMTEPQIPPVVNLPPVIQPPVVETGASPPQAIPPQESFEIRLGTYWLPRIGIAVLLTGMVFFAAYITPRLGVAQKVAVSYLACIVLGVVGMALEKKMP